MAETIRVDIDGMSCDHCVQTLEKGLKTVPGVERVKVNLREKQAVIEVAKKSSDLEAQVRSTVADLGYEVVGIAA